MTNLAIFASGSGTNAENIARYFSGSERIRVSLVLSNRPDAYVLERASRLGIPVLVFSRGDLYETGKVMEVLEEHRIDFLVLAGFLWLVPSGLLEVYRGRVINIHPALLPRFGGKGMYGDRVHRAVIESGEKRTGITIHYVNERYDEGQVIFQESFEILPGDTPESIAERVHRLEYAHFPRVIQEVVENWEKGNERVGVSG
jgi:phosphoribosylglycinamide formyltransferase-1